MKKLTAFAIAAVLTVGPFAAVASAGHEWHGNSWSSHTDKKAGHAMPVYAS